MEVLMAILIGVLTAASVYLMLSENLVRFLFGLILLSNAANLTIFTAGRIDSSAPPLIPVGADAPLTEVANALPQALVLTAIVIGFGLFAFALVLTFRAYTELGTLNTDKMRVAEPIEGEPAAAETRSAGEARS
ncbi:MAG: Na+/H+ antiporter subunit C [Pseudomonadota bacterium]